MHHKEKFKVTLRYPSDKIRLLNDRSCSITISIGQKNQEGSRFSATLHEINKNFNECTIMLCDTLQRYTLAIQNNNKESENYKHALKLGDDWLADNRIYFSNLDIPFTILRWDRWINDINFSSKKILIENLYSSNNEFRSALNTAYEIYEDRYVKNNKPFLSLKHLENCCIAYLKEECAVMLLWAEQGYNYEIYPSKRNLAMAATYDLIIEPNIANVLQPIYLDIRSIAVKALDKISD